MAHVTPRGSFDVVRVLRPEPRHRTRRMRAQPTGSLAVPLRVIVGLALLSITACHPNPVDPQPAAEFASARARLLAELRSEGINDPRVVNALSQVPRHEFVRVEDRPYAYLNEPLPIGRGQTISQPSVVALMTQLLQLRGDERVLEVGTGSGYQAAVLAMVAREVYSIEIDPFLAAAAAERLARLGYQNVHVRTGDGWYGWEEAAPFDAILVTAAAPTIPERLVAQLKSGGRLVMPLGGEPHQILIRGRKQDHQLNVERFTDVLFVPMTGATRTPTP